MNIIEHLPYTVNLGPHPSDITTECHIADSAALAAAGGDKSAWTRALVDVLALWDTGANMSLIDRRLARDLGLPKHPKHRAFRTAVRTEMREVYLAALVLPNQTFIRQTEFISAELPKHDIVIGMDVIGLLDMAISHNDKGETIFSFTHPPLNMPLDFANVDDGA